MVAMHRRVIKQPVRGVRFILVWCATAMTAVAAWGQCYPSISALARDEDTPTELRLEYFRSGNIQVPDDVSFTNSVGMELVRIPAGEFRMGNDGEIDYTQVATDAVHASYIRKGGPNPHIKNGPPMAANPLEWDETPSHQTRITTAYYMASKPVTNEQYERFRPEHRALRGKRGYSHGDDDAVLYVSWHDAIAYTKWLSEKEGRPYRLPTEAEWEYAARAGTTTPYFTGDSLPQAYHRHQVMNRSHVLAPEKVDLEVGKTPPNAWGLFDMHGLVEEWCMDWYGPYAADADIDPVGPADGVARVTRGGSHSTGLPFLRSANRSGALPETSHFLIGFRVVMGKMPETRPTQKTITRQWATNVNQTDHNWSASKVSKKKPIFKEPKTYTRIPPDANGPMYFIHNHNPALSVLPNGDLLSVWFTTVKERGREMLVAAARLRKGEDEWDPADIFFNVPDRNQTGQALWWDGNKTIYHLSGVGTADHWRDLSLVMRTSTDNGVTWSKPKIIGPEYGPRQQPIDAVIGTSKGEIILACDAGADRSGSVIHISRDHGQTWIDPGQNMPEPKFIEGETGAWIAGIHACIAELKDGSLLAFGRADDIGGRMPKSISKDGGKTWTYSASDFEPIGSAQRASMIRLNEGPLMIVSFSQSLNQTDAAGNTFTGTGMYAALSYDEGRTWPVRKLITDGQHRVLDAPSNKRWGEEFGTLDYNRAEGRGYLTATQSPDGMIHVLSSGTHYSFNLAWVEARFPARSTKSN